MIAVKPSEMPPVMRYVVRNSERFYYDGHGESVDGGPPTGEFGVPCFNTKNILFAIKYGDVESIEQMIKNHKKWCIDHNRDDLFHLFDTCEVLETYT